MERVVLDGVSYVRVADAAEQFGYTSDYVGQLCRGKKVNARLVGRAWYVNIDSIKEYRQAKHDKRKVRSSEKKRKKTLKNKVLIKVVAPDRPLKLSVHNADETVSKNNVTVRYETDKADLLPKVTRLHVVEQIAAKISDEPVIEQAASFAKLGDIAGEAIPVEAEKKAKIKVESQRSHKPTNLFATELPTVSLQGNLSVADATDVEPEQLEEAEADTTVVEEPKKRSKIVLFLLGLFRLITWPVRLTWKLLYPVRKVLLLLLHPFVLLYARAKRFSKKKSLSQDVKQVSFAPKTAQPKIVSTYVETTEIQHHIRLWSLLLSAILTALLLLSLGSELTTFGGASKLTFFIDRSWIFDLLTRL